MFLVRHKSKVLMADGTKKPIGDLMLGDVVRGYKQDNIVKGIYRRVSKDTLYDYHPELQGLTAGQPVMTKDSWGCIDVSAGLEDNPQLSLMPLRNEDYMLEHIDGYVYPCLVPYDERDESEKIALELDGDNTFYVNGFLVHNKGQSGGSTTTTTEVPDYLKPYVKEVASEASKAYSEVPKDGYQGGLTAPVNATQQQANTMAKDVVMGLGNYGQDTGAIAAQQAQRITGGNILNAGQNTFQTQSADTTGVIEAALNPVRENLMENIIPQIQSQAIQSGAYGGTRQDVVTQQALQDYSREAANIAANIGYQDFVRTEDQRFADAQARNDRAVENERLQQTAALSLPDLQNAGLQQQLTQSDLLAAIGGTEQAFDQNALTEAYNQYLLSVQSPYAGLSEYAALLSGIPIGGTATATSTGGSAGSSPIAGAMGGALSGAQLGSLVPGIGTVAGGVGGAILGGLFG